MNVHRMHLIHFSFSHVSLSLSCVHSRTYVRVVRAEKTSEYFDGHNQIINSAHVHRHMHPRENLLQQRQLLNLHTHTHTHTHTILIHRCGLTWKSIICRSTYPVGAGMLRGNFILHDHIRAYKLNIITCVRTFFLSLCLFVSLFLFRRRRRHRCRRCCCNFNIRVI